MAAEQADDYHRRAGPFRAHMDGSAVVTAYRDLGKVEQPFSEANLKART